jgi:hypothetical protein
LQTLGFDASTFKFQKAGPCLPEFSKKSPGARFKMEETEKKGAAGDFAMWLRK